MRKAIAIFGLCGLFVVSTALAHHSVLNYDGKVEIKISGVVTAARFGFPHSVYKIDVTADDGSIEEWVLSTEDPRDSRPSVALPGWNRRHDASWKLHLAKRHSASGSIRHET